MLELFALFAIVTRLVLRAPGRTAGEPLPWGEFRGVLRFSAGVAFTALAWLLLTQGDRLILSRLLSLANYGIFAVAVSASSAVAGLGAPIAQAILPRLTRLNNSGETAAALVLYSRATQVTCLIAMPAALVLACFAAPVIWIWTGNPLMARQAAPVLAAYAVGGGLATLTAFPYYLQYSHGSLEAARHRSGAVARHHGPGHDRRGDAVGAGGNRGCVDLSQRRLHPPVGAGRAPTLRPRAARPMAGAGHRAHRRGGGRRRDHARPSLEVAGRPPRSGGGTGQCFLGRPAGRAHRLLGRARRAARRPGGMEIAVADPATPMAQAPNPKVSVCVVTYNHEDYIEACLASVLGQTTDFDFEVVVGDDCSTDATGAILERLARDHPGRLRLIRHPVNLGPTRNFLATHNASRGEYVAIFDGDDMALPGKLARQAALLDDAPGLVACGHRMQVIDEDGRPTGRHYPARLAPIFDLGKAIRCGVPVCHSSIMYRAGARSLRVCDFELFDWFILTDLLLSGDAGYIVDDLGSYRVNPESMTGQMKMAAMQERMIGLYQRRLAELPGRRRDFFAHAVFMTLVCLRMGLPFTPAHRRLLMSSWTPWAFGQLLDALAWARANGAALAR